MKDHRLIDERSLEFDRLTALKITADPALIERARGTLERWLRTCSPRVRPVLLEWQAVLEGPLEALLALLARTDEGAVRLRQSSPFAGIFTVEERTRVLHGFQRRESTGA